MKTKTIESRLSIYKDRIPEVQKGVFKDEYKWWLLSLSLSCSFLGFFFFFGSRGLFVVIIVINGINVCLAFLRCSFGRLFGFKLTSYIQNSISIDYSNKNMLLGPILVKFKFFFWIWYILKKMFFFIIRKLSIPRWPWSWWREGDRCLRKLLVRITKQAS